MKKVKKTKIVQMTDEMIDSVTDVLKSEIKS